MKTFWIFVFSIVVLVASDVNVTKDLIAQKESRLVEINKILSQDEILNKYKQYLESKQLNSKLNFVNKRLKYLKRRRKTKKVLSEIEDLQKTKLTIEAKLNILKGSSVFEDIISFKKIPEQPEIKNPFLIFEGIQYKKDILSYKQMYENRYSQFLKSIDLLLEKRDILSLLNKDDNILDEEIDDMYLIKDIYKTKLKALSSNIELHINQINKEINHQLTKLMNLIITIVVSFLIFTAMKIILRKYVVKDDDIYILNKSLNILNFTVIILIIAFFYIDNATYLVTILGFASAGIAIAMKDWFMSIFGWFVIVSSGSFKVGDRVKIYYQNGQIQIVGDVIDISLTKIVIHEDITLSTYTHNRRAGRMIFVPNNTIFTNPIFNYSHNGLKSVWDGIDVTIKFDSNHKKAVYLAKEIAKKYSKGYTDLTRKQLNKLRATYNIKNTNVEPRVYTFIEANGIVISCWYMNSYATMSLRSIISAEILDAFNKEDDINIAYDTHTIEIKNDRKFIKD